MSMSRQEGFNINALPFDMDPTVDGAILFQQDNDNPGNGRVQAFNASESILAEPNAFFDNEETHPALISVLAPNGYGSGETADSFVLVDGGNPISSSITFDGENSGYLALYSNQTGATVDNLVISAIGTEQRRCDFNGDDTCDLVDLDDLLYNGRESQSLNYDLSGDGSVD